MAVVIKTKNKATGIPASLEVGELAVNTTDGKLFVGSASGVIQINDRLLALNNTWTGLNTFTGGLRSNGAGTESFRAGSSAGETNQGDRAVAIGYLAGYEDQGNYSISIGNRAGEEKQGQFGVAVGFQAGYKDQENFALAIGASAGEKRQGELSVALGYQAGYEDQKKFAVAIGNRAGKNTQGENSVAIGQYAADLSQGDDCIAIGNRAGQTSQRDKNIAIGYEAGNSNQKEICIAIGYCAGKTNQGAGAVAIGQYAGETGQGIRSLVINASGTAQTAATGDVNISSGSFWLRTSASGGWSANTAISNASDETLKKNIELIPDALNKVNTLRGVTFNWLDDERDAQVRQTGLIAQDLQAVLPEVVKVTEEGTLAVQYGPIVGLLVESIKELTERVEALEA